LNVKDAVLVPSLFIVLFLNHLTSGSGIPDAVQVILTADPSMYFDGSVVILICGATANIVDVVLT